MKKTKIICSIGPADMSANTLEKMVNVGMDVARINCSHADVLQKENTVKVINEVRHRTNKNIGIMYDTKGPEFRTGDVVNGSINLIEDNIIKIVTDEIVGDTSRICVNHPEVLANIAPGDVILVENGLMKLKVIDSNIEGLTCKIITGGVLGDKKSIAVPGVKLDLPFISNQDREDIIYACKNEGDFLALSFVNSSEDVKKVREICEENKRSDMVLIAKIESHMGVVNLDEIIDASDGIMVARGDLGVEIPMEELPMVQKKITRKCREHGKICIIATEMLESMKASIRPTRAEVSDVYNAVFDGTDAVMLSGETAVGKYPVETVKYMADICKEAEDNYDYSRTFKSKEELDITNIIAKGVVDATGMTNVKAVVAATMSGYTARKISNLKPDSPILAICSTYAVAHSLALNWGVYTTVAPIFNTTDDLIKYAKEEAVKKMDLEDGDMLVITGGFPTGKSKATNFMKIEEI